MPEELTPEEVLLSITTSIEAMSPEENLTQQVRQLAELNEKVLNNIFPNDIEAEKQKL